VVEDKAQDLLDAILHAMPVGVQNNIRLDRLFVRRRYPGIILYFSGSGQFVEALDVTPFTFLKRAANIDLKQPAFADD
jgi:hypothetical protein